MSQRRISPSLDCHSARASVRPSGAKAMAWNLPVPVHTTALLAGGGIPEPHLASHAGRGQGAPDRRERQPGDLVGVGPDDASLVPYGHIES